MMNWVIACSDDLHVAFEFPVGHSGLELAPFPLAGGSKVVDKVVAEDFTGDLGRVEVLSSLEEVSGELASQRVVGHHRSDGHGVRIERAFGRKKNVSDLLCVDHRKKNRR